MKPDELIAATVEHFGGISEAQAREVWRVVEYNSVKRISAIVGRREFPSFALPPAEWGGTP